MNQMTKFARIQFYSELFSFPMQNPFLIFFFTNFSFLTSIYASEIQFCLNKYIF